jgi:glycosyltransferase involved in cell wall biosynthesis
MKGLTFLLEALARLREDRLVELIVIGKLRPEGATARRIGELGLEGAVRFVSGVSEERLVELYNEAVLAVVPSLYEGFSLPAVEAMACGAPLVATTGGALPEVVGRDGETVLLVPPGDSVRLAERIAFALDRPELRQRLGTFGRQWVLDRWTWRHTALGTVEQYRALLEERRRVPRSSPPASA